MPKYEKKPETPAAPNGGDVQSIVDDALAAEQLKSAHTVAKETLTGDLRDAALDWIRALRRPWAQMSEDEQRDVIESVARQAALMAGRAVEIIAAHRPDSVSAIFKKFTADEGLKIQLEATESEENVVALLRLRGLRAIIAAADVSPFVGEQKPAKPDPQQPELPVATAGDGEQPEAGA